MNRYLGTVVFMGAYKLFINVYFLFWGNIWMSSIVSNSDRKWIVVEV